MAESKIVPNWRVLVSIVGQEIDERVEKSLKIMARVGTLLIVLRNGDLLSIDQH